MDHEETLRNINAMRRQEESEYFCCDYFYQDAADNFSNEDETDSHGNSMAPCDPLCRQVMFYWMVRVVDFFPSMHRETVAYAMSYLDRFLQSEAGAPARRQRSTFQLAAIACLYTSVKIHEHAAVSPKFLEQLSRDEYSVKDVERMEMTILQALKWRLSTPTALTFLRHFMALIPRVLLNDSLREQVYDMAKFQTEVALGDYKYVTVNFSCIAYCSLMNALEALRIDSRRIGWLMSEAAHIVRDSIYTLEIKRSLAMDHSNHAGLKGSPTSVGYEHLDKSRECQARAGYHSPRTVCKTT